MRNQTLFAVLGGAAAALAGWPQPLQQLKQAVLGSPKHLAEKYDLPQAKEHLKHNVAQAWNDVAKLYPEAMRQAMSPVEGSNTISPKKAARRPDSFWDHITHGASLTKDTLESAAEQAEHESLAAYSMRSRSTHPADLGVDPGVKQISGYLDDHETDKHLFYCKFCAHSCRMILHFSICALFCAKTLRLLLCNAEISTMVFENILASTISKVECFEVLLIIPNWAGRPFKAHRSCL